jgi:hypothetical protein
MITLLCIAGAMNLIVGFLLALAVWLESRRRPGELGWILTDPPCTTMDGMTRES